MERAQFVGEVDAAVELREVEDFRRAPAYRQAVDLVVGHRPVEHVEEAGIGIRRVIHDDVRPRRHAAGLLDVERRLARAGRAAQRSAAVHVDLGDPVGFHAQADRAPVGVCVGGDEVRQGGDADGRALAVHAELVQRVDVVAVGHVAHGEFADRAGSGGIAGARRGRRRALGQGVGALLRRKDRADPVRVVARFAAQARGHHQRAGKRGGNGGRRVRLMEGRAVAGAVVVDGGVEGRVELPDGAADLDGQVVRQKFELGQPVLLEERLDSGDLAGGGAIAVGKLRGGEEAVERGAAAGDGAVDEFFQGVLVVQSEHQRDAYRLARIACPEVGGSRATGSEAERAEATKQQRHRSRERRAMQFLEHVFISKGRGGRRWRARTSMA